MIVRPALHGVHLITQPDHAHLALRIMEHCARLGSRPRRDSILHAIAEHDNGWIEADRSPTVNPKTRRLADFVNVPIAVRHGVWPRGVARLAGDPYAAALVALHAITVYDRFRGDGEWTQFFAGLEQSRDGMLRLSGARPEELADDYPFLRLGDLLSLAFCTGTTEAIPFQEWTVRFSGARVVATPDLFDGATIRIEVGARELDDRIFGTNQELRDAVANAPMTILRGEVAGSLVHPG